MKTKTTFYKIVGHYPGESKMKYQTSLPIETLKEAQEFILDHLNGCPSNENMSDESRGYWREVGESMVIQKITRTETIETIEYANAV